MIMQHGGNISRIENILDFSANINPLGAPESVKEMLRNSIPDVEKYPDPYCTELRKRLAGHEHIPAANIVCGSGADDLIFRIVHALKPEKALVCAPAFSEYSRALRECGCEVCEHFLAEESGFAVTGNLAARLDSSFDICFLCTPNNPAGRLIQPEILRDIARACDENGIVLLCDECFLGFAEDGGKYSLRSFLGEKCIVIDAFTKLYAMPGIRLGYAVFGSSDLAERVRGTGQFWSVSSLAQSAGLAALGEEDYVRRTVSFVAAEREFLSAELRSLGAEVFPSAANFLLFRSSTGLAEKMLAEGILIRDCSNFSGLSDGFYRVAVRTREENIRLVSALRRCIYG